jgi:hypothetical protein
VALPAALEALAEAVAPAEVDAEEADLELVEEVDFEDEEVEDADEVDADESDAEELVVEMVIPPFEPADALLLEEPGFSMNMAKATMAASTAIAAMTKTTVPPPARLGVGSNCLTGRGAVPPPAVPPAT